MKKIIGVTIIFTILLLNSLSFLPAVYSDATDESSKTDENSQGAEQSKAKEESTWEQFKDMIKRSSYDTFVLPFEFLWDAVRGFPEDRPISGTSTPPQNPPQEGNPPLGRSSGPYVPPSSTYGLPNVYGIDQSALDGRKVESTFDASDAVRGGADTMTGNENPGVDARSMQSSHMSAGVSTQPAEGGYHHSPSDKDH